MSFTCQAPVLINKNTLQQNRIYLQNKYSQPNVASQKARQAKQNIINSFPALLNSFCTNPVPALLTINNLNADQVQEISKYKKDEECLVNALTSSSYLAKRIVGSVPVNLFLDNYARIGKPSVFGNVIKFDYHNPNGTNISLPFVVKTSKEIDDMTLKNEALIGYYLNFLRLYVPNFVYTLGVTQCSPAIVNDNGKVESFCDANGDQPYIIIEKVVNPITLKDYINNVNTTFEDWFNIFIQVLIALYHSQALDFTHYDLHYENVLLSKSNSTDIMTGISNNINGKQYYVNTPFGNRYLQYTYLAKIIDFGYGHTTIQTSYKNTIFYGQFNPVYNVFADKSFLLYDVYKLLMFSLYEVTASSRTDQQKIDFLTNAWPLYTYFNFTAKSSYNPGYVQPNFDALMADIEYGAGNSYTLFTTEQQRSQLNFNNFMQCVYNNYQQYWNKYLPTIAQPNVPIYEFNEISPNYDIWSGIVNQSVIQNQPIYNYRQAWYLHQLLFTSNNKYKQIITNNIINFIDNDWLVGLYPGIERNIEQLTVNIKNIGLAMDNFVGNTAGVNIDYDLTNAEQIGLNFVNILHQIQNIFQRYVEFMQFNTIIPTYNISISDLIKQKLSSLQQLACSYYQYIYNEFLQNSFGQQYLTTSDGVNHQTFNARYTFTNLLNMIDNNRPQITDPKLKRKYNVVGRLIDNIIELIDDTITTGGNKLVCQV